MVEDQHRATLESTATQKKKKTFKRENKFLTHIRKKKITLGNIHEQFQRKLTLCSTDCLATGKGPSKTLGFLRKKCSKSNIKRTTAQIKIVFI